MDKQSPEISVVVPLLDEQDNLGLLYEQISQTLADEYSYEIIFVDDGSNDDSFTVLANVQKNDNKVRIARTSGKPRHLARALPTHEEILSSRLTQIYKTILQIYPK